jgi:hypothetical protein
LLVCRQSEKRIFRWSGVTNGTLFTPIAPRQPGDDETG